MRYFIYVNTNSDRKHITIHCESKKSCSDVMKNIIKNIPGSISSVNIDNKDILRLGETGNGFWLLVHGQYNNDQEILDIVNKTNIKNIQFNLNDIIRHC